MINDEDGPIDNDLADSIAMLEQILEVMPHDIIALKALYNAYTQAGQNKNAFDYLKKLAEAVVSASDAEGLAFVESQLVRFEADFAEQVELLRAKVSGSFAPLSTRSSPTISPIHTETAGERDINEELALAWRLYEEEQLSQEEYSSVLHDLTEISSKEIGVPVSVLHVLNDRGFSQMSRVMNFLSARSGVPYLMLTDFELNPNVSEFVPFEIAQRDGAMPFGLVGEDLMLAILNPYNKGLIEKVSRISGRRCHTFLVGPDEYDRTLESFLKLVL